MTACLVIHPSTIIMATIRIRDLEIKVVAKMMEDFQIIQVVKIRTDKTRVIRDHNKVKKLYSMNLEIRFNKILRKNI